MTLRVTILGCGSSGGVPRVGGDWGVCDPNEPKNRRTRCSLLVEQWEGDVEPDNQEKTVILIDTSPDLREQLLKAKVTKIDAVLYTHDHADQSHGIDDLRAIAYRMRQRIPVYMDDITKEAMLSRFHYCFEMPEGRVHPAILELQDTFNSKDELQIFGAGGAINITVLGLSHGPSSSFGFKFNNIVTYTPDVLDIENDVLNLIKGSDVWVCDALRYNRSPSHANVDKTLMWQAFTQVPTILLTNLHIDLDYENLTSELLGSQVVAYDGQRVELD